MGLNSVYGRQAKDYTLSTAAFRFAVVSKVCGLDNIDDVQILDSKQFRGICGKPMTETLERLLLLYGAGIIDFTVIEDLVTIKEDISDVLRTAEEFLIDQMQKYEKLRMPLDVFNELLLCSAKSVSYCGNDPITFDEACNLNNIGCATIVSGLVKVNDYEIMKLLAENGEEFGNMAPGIPFEIEYDINNYLGNPEVQAGNVESIEYPCMAHPKHLIQYNKVIKLLYGADFLRHLSKQRMPVDNSIMARYEGYLNHIKCEFNIHCCHRKRNVCGDKVNQFDYFTNINNDALAFDKMERVNIKPASEKSDDELMRMAVDEFCSRSPVVNGDVLEIHNQGKITLLYVKDGQYIPLNSDDFRSSLFNYKEVWGKIQEYATEHNIKAVNGVVQIPMELINEFNENDREYAKNLIIEQYSRQTEHKGGHVLTKLSELMAAASEEMAKSEKLKKHQADLKQETANKRAGRKSGTEENDQ